MQIRNIYPCALGTAFNPFLAKQLLPICRNILQDEEKLSPYLGYKSTYDPARSLDDMIDVPKELLNFKEFAYKECVKYLNQLGYMTDVMNLEIQLAVNKMEYGDSHQTHVHPGVLVTGTFYLSVPTGSSPLYVADPRTLKQMNTTPMAFETDYTADIIDIDIKEGTLVIMEGYMGHGVRKNLSEERIVLIFNLVDKR